MQRQEFVTSPKSNPASVVAGDKFRITVLTEGLIRYEYADDGVFEDRASTFAICRNLPKPEFTLIDEPGHLEIVTDYFHLHYDKNKLSASGFSVQIKGNITDWKSNWRYGGGIKQEWYYLYGTARTLDEADGRIPLEHGVLARNGYAHLDDSTSSVFTDDGFMTGRRPGDRVDNYLFAYGRNYKAAIKAFFAVSGSQPLLPRWALGNWWSRYYKYSDKTYLELLDRFRKENLPFSVGVLDMDWHMVDNPVVKKTGFSGWTGYTWEKALFPDPKGFVSELHKRGVKTCLNDHPADGIPSYEDTYEAMAKHLGRDSSKGHPIPFDIADKKFLDGYFDIVMKAREDDGVDFWWVDWQQGPYSKVPGVDPLWLLNHFHFLNNKRGNTRPLTFSRFAGPGSHRYPVGFSGDTVVSWESLDFQPEFTATSSNIGYGWWSHDIGGHMQGYRDDELATRWVQLGVFSPINRLHSSNNHWNSKEPWRFNAEARALMDNALRLRHQILPYLYTMNVLSARDNEPLIQPLYWSFPDNDEAYCNKNTYMFGSELLVAPLTKPRDKVTLRSRVEVWLPPGRHVDLFSGIVYDGDRRVAAHRKLDEYAVFAREGSIVPLDASKTPDNDCRNPSSLEIKVLVGADGFFEMYEDDDKGSSLDKVKFVKTPVRWTQAEGKLTVGPASGTASIPDKRDWRFTFVTLKQDDLSKFTAKVDGKPVQLDSALSLTGVSVTSQIEILSNSSNPQLAVNEPSKLAFKIVDDAQSFFEEKNTVWAVMDGKRPLSTKVSDLMALQVDAGLKDALAEVLLADSRVFE